MGEKAAGSPSVRGGSTPVANESPELTTEDRLLKQYNGLVIIPVERVSQDYFQMTPEIFMRKVNAGEIRIPIVRMYDNSQRAAKGVYVKSLAEYIDKRHALAMKEFHTLYD